MVVVYRIDYNLSELKVPRDAHVIEAPNAPTYGLNPTASCPLTLAPIKRVLVVHLANEISELMAHPQRVDS
jgi:hypothetical protein